MRLALELVDVLSTASVTAQAAAGPAVIKPVAFVASVAARVNVPAGVIVLGAVIALDNAAARATESTVKPL